MPKPSEMPRVSGVIPPRPVVVYASLVDLHYKAPPKTNWHNCSGKGCLGC